MLKNLDAFAELGTVGVAYTGGGVWIAYLPIVVGDGERLHLTYDSEAYYNDDNAPEFTVYKGDTYTTEYDFAQEMAEEYGDDCPACFVNIKDFVLISIYNKLRGAIQKALKEDKPFDSVPFNKE